MFLTTVGIGTEPLAHFRNTNEYVWAKLTIVEIGRIRVKINLTKIEELKYKHVQ